MTVMATTAPGRERDLAISSLADEINARLLDGGESVLMVTNQRTRSAEIRFTGFRFRVDLASGSTVYDPEGYADSLTVAEVVERWLREVPA